MAHHITVIAIMFSSFKDISQQFPFIVTEFLENPLFG